LTFVDFDNLILLLDTVSVEDSPNESSAVWQKTSVRNLVRYAPSGKFFARVRVKGRLIRRSLKTTALSVAKLRLADLEKSERQMAEHAVAFDTGKMVFSDALKIYRDRLHADGSQTLHRISTSAIAWCVAWRQVPAPPQSNTTTSRSSGR